jgi:predicted nucleotidyltransferase component of viral defense system
MTRLKPWQIEHKKIIQDVLKTLNEETDAFILKGGTALMTCYKLDRFSEDIDLDSTHKRMKEFVRRYSNNHGYNFRIAKDTPSVQRFFVNYGNDEKPLKIEVSFRNHHIPKEFVTNVDGIEVYTIDRLAQLKASAYQNRDKIRDLYDLCFICDKHFKELEPRTVVQIQDALAYKGLDYFDYIVNTQKDPLIDPDKLADSFLKMYDKLDLLRDPKEEATLRVEKKPSR